MHTRTAPWNDVLDFWFPEGRSSEIAAETHRDYWSWRLHGGADGTIVARFADITSSAASGDLDDWADDPEGRLALIILLDQFSRSLWRGTPRAFAQDPAALSLAMEGFSNGHYASLGTPWFRIVYSQPLGHCEGQDHLARIDLLIRLREEIAAGTPASLQPIYQSLVRQAGDVRKVIAAFGRHPHRNQVLGRESTQAEEAYITKGDFPHDRAFQA
ncbi:DUF924 family protein [Pseudochrobactrum asaccharolyticum]|uniref:Uncharacterized protein (DUF924 family) n=1 Tax=Pseudochrobactrum asaccharolyticum TaxID=354351 RepID=A0A366DK30_9HYPH|nr:DUF924 family protein [Pseudochrobactrum asaccharolyticum]MBX8802345.1 DUF924 domain-containing protein [Ochrobactrum sp. MR28]MBX8817863.1 DUF924 domain-containing protein [Ochrobactrum sp. MR31]RBO90430.1 uncharacterized protein (DUF924 family) [Pseudochrobactrum asaccharolyticum]